MNFVEPYHEELSSQAWSVWQDHIPCWQKDYLLLTGPGIYPQVYHRTPCLAVLICEGSCKKQRRGRIISNFPKGRLFHVVYISTKLWFCIVVPLHFIAPFPFSLGKKRIYLETQWKGEFTDLFWKFPWCSLFPQAE